MRMMKERELCSAGGCRISFEKSIVQIVVYEAVSDHVHVEVVLLRHDSIHDMRGETNEADMCQPACSCSAWPMQALRWDISQLVC